MAKKSKPRIDVMVSSTVRDLKDHRDATRDAILQAGMFPLRMEEAGAQTGVDAVRFSQDLVRDADVYVGIFAFHYGYVPEGEGLTGMSVTEIEYRAWIERRAEDGMPGLLFLMDAEHPIPRSAYDGKNLEKIEALRNEIGSRYVVAFFTTPDDLRGKVQQALETHREEIEERLTSGTAEPVGEKQEHGPSSIPSPPEMYSAPAYVPGFEFVGRRSEIEELDCWAGSGTLLMVVEAIGGMGKSALTWHWTTTRARKVVPDLAGIFWFSFYERGARLTSCLQNALAYLTSRPLKDFRGRKAGDLAEEVLTELQRKPYLLVLDGMERVLVAYHRMDASQIRDDQVESDQRSCIDPADTEALRRLCSCVPSRVLVSTRLFPRALENKAHRPLPGVARKELRGLGEDDAATFLDQVGIFGDETAMLRFTAQFEHHPLMLGVVAGLINDYTRDPGNFDRWHADQEAGGRLELSKLDLVQRRSHILHHALEGLDPQVRQVLCRAAAFSTAVDYETLAVINPFNNSKAFDQSLRELEERGLLQFDRSKRTYDLHPVVRGYALDLLDGKDRIQTFSTLADHFQSRPEDRYDDVKDLADLENSLAIFRALIGARKFEEALRFYSGSFAQALLYSCEAYPTIIELLMPLLPKGLEEPPAGISVRLQSYTTNELALALAGSGRSEEALKLRALTLRLHLEDRETKFLHTVLSNFSSSLFDQNHLAAAEHGFRLQLRIAEALEGPHITRAHFDLMACAIIFGNWNEAARFEEAFRQGKAPPHRTVLQPGNFECRLCWMHFSRGQLDESTLNEAFRIATQANSRWVIRALHDLRGEWELERSHLQDAAAAFGEAIVMTQKAGAPVSDLRARLALARAQQGKTQAAADLLAECGDDTQDWRLAEAWLTLGDKERALEHGMKGYKWAWADGPPYIRWWPLQRMKKLLAELGVEPPELPPFDPDAVEPLPYEDEIIAFIEELEQEQTAS